MPARSKISYMPENDFENAMRDALETEEVYRGMSVENVVFCADVSRLSFAEDKFFACCFEKSDFSACAFDRCVFESCDFSGCNFEDAYFNGCVFENRRLVHTSILRAKRVEYEAYSCTFFIYSILC